MVQKLAGIATREVPGVYAMGSAGRRAFSALTERIPGSQTNVSGGVSVEKGERQTAIDVSIVIDYGFSVVEVSQAIRRNIIQSVERATGLEVLEVNINVTDVHLPDDDHDDQQVQKTRTPVTARHSILRQGNGTMRKRMAMSTTRWCLTIGLVLGIVLGFGGWLALLSAVILGFIGLLVGRVAEGKLDLQALFGRASSR